MQDVYKQNNALGDPGSLAKQLEENGVKLDRLRLELQKFEVLIEALDSSSNIFIYLITKVKLKNYLSTSLKF